MRNNDRKRKLEFGDNGFGGIGGYLELRKEKLRKQFLENAEIENNLFDGKTFWINGRTKPPAHELEVLLGRFGGVRDYVLTPRTDFHIVENLPRAKRIKLRDYDKIIHTTFVTDSIKEGKLLDWRDYRHWNNEFGVETINTCSIIGSLSRPDGCKSTYNLQPNGDRDKLMPSLVDFMNGRSLPESWNVFNSPEKTIFEFYRNSRLHWLSTWRTELADWVRKRAKISSANQNSKISKTENRPFVIHIDIDCFFVAVALRKNPELKGKPVAICHGSGKAKKNRDMVDISKEIEMIESKRKISIKRDLDQSESFSEIASCSYEARSKGVRSGMYLGAAKKLCPDIVCLDYDLPACAEISEILYDVVSRRTDIIESVSCDELYADMSDYISDSLENPDVILAEIRADFESRTGITASIGGGQNKLLARLATNKAKPNGVFIVPVDAILGFMKNIKVSDLPGVGPSILRKISQEGNFNNLLCGELLTKNEKFFIKKLGQINGHKIFSNIRGKGTERSDRVEVNKPRKSVSAEINYGIRFKNWIMAEDFIMAFTRHIYDKLEGIGLKSRKVMVKLHSRANDAPFEPSKYGGMGLCDETLKTIARPVLSADQLGKMSLNILRNMDVEPWNFRGIGIHIELDQVVEEVKKKVPKIFKKLKAEKGDPSDFKAMGEGLLEAENMTSISELSEIERGILTAVKTSESREKIMILIRENIKNWPEKIFNFLPILIKIRPDLFSTFVDCFKEFHSEKLSEKCIKTILERFLQPIQTSLENVFGTNYRKQFNF